MIKMATEEKLNAIKCNLISPGYILMATQNYVCGIQLVLTLKKRQIINEHTTVNTKLNNIPFPFILFNDFLLITYECSKSAE
jgi:hypothetical protein